MTILATFSNDLASIAESAGRAVVQVDARHGGAASGVIWPSKDLVVTANHVLMRDDNISIGMGDGNAVEGTLVGRDPTTDLALLKLENPIDYSPEWMGVNDLKVGHFVLSLGRPGKSIRAVLGIVSVFGEKWRTPAGGTIENYIQSDATIYPGFSGGPTVTVEGKVLGITTTGLSRVSPVIIPTATVKSVVGELLKHGRISRGYLGVGIQPVRLPSELDPQVEQETGLLVISVESGSPGARSGLMLGDTILAIGEDKVRHWDDLLGALNKDRIGKSIPVKIIRAGSIRELQVVIGERQ